MESGQALTLLVTALAQMHSHAVRKHLRTGACRAEQHLCNRHSKQVLPASCMPLDKSACHYSRPRSAKHRQPRLDLSAELPSKCWLLHMHADKFAQICISAQASCTAPAGCTAAIVSHEQAQACHPGVLAAIATQAQANSVRLHQVQQRLNGRGAARAFETCPLGTDGLPACFAVTGPTAGMCTAEGAPSVHPPAGCSAGCRDHAGTARQSRCPGICGGPCMTP